ncbi:uncharacterized protein LOC135216658 [Macrobrachium nipponense]|uniref:uncharacterized protein LOC135216658 n=1 Tax=Macrobrachium nipponense TaxID=159736 RepID=UPI0030C86289
MRLLEDVGGGGGGGGGRGGEGGGGKGGVEEEEDVEEEVEEEDDRRMKMRRRRQDEEEMEIPYDLDCTICYEGLQVMMTHDISLPDLVTCGRFGQYDSGIQPRDGEPLLGIFRIGWNIPYWMVLVKSSTFTN